MEKSGDIEKDIKTYRELIEETLERLVKDVDRNRYGISIN